MAIGAIQATYSFHSIPPCAIPGFCCSTAVGVQIGHTRRRDSAIPALVRHREHGRAKHWSHCWQAQSRVEHAGICHGSVGPCGSVAWRVFSRCCNRQSDRRYSHDEPVDQLHLRWSPLGGTGDPSQPCSSISPRPDPCAACNSKAIRNKRRSDETSAEAIEGWRSLSKG
jgi:hypothetical protein